MTSCGIHELVDSWEGETVLRTYSIKIGEVNLHPPFHVVLLHRDWVGDPLRILGLLDEAFLNQLLYFFL